MTNLRLKCPECNRGFSFNPSRHEHDQFVLSPCCRIKVKNPTYSGLPSFLKEWEERVKRWRIERERRKETEREIWKVLDTYFPIHPITGRRAFGMNDWRKGKRPVIPLVVIAKKIGGSPVLIEEEAKRLQRIGFRILDSPLPDGNWLQ